MELKTLGNRAVTMDPKEQASTSLLLIVFDTVLLGGAESLTFTKLA